MHGVRRGRKPTAAQLKSELEKSSYKADLIRQSLIIRNRPVPREIGEQFRKEYQVVQRALEANPDEYTLWSFRREVLLASVQSKRNEDPDGNKCIKVSGQQYAITESNESADKLWRFELDLTTNALRRHPKAYPAWQHRLWLLESRKIGNYISEKLRKRAIAEEQILSEYMLSKDGRNFHSWAHRMRVRALVLSETPQKEDALNQEELSFVSERIFDDFANYSAWHHRSVLLPKVHNGNQDEFLHDELQFVRQAFYTEPDVQSAWFYHQWLLAGAPARGKKGIVKPEVLEDELEACDELLELEPDARYALQRKAQLLLELRKIDELEGVVELLIQRDPMRRGYYEYLRKKGSMLTL